jgi:hypothetical protein
MRVRHDFGLLTRQKRLRKSLTTCIEVSGPHERFERAPTGYKADVYYISDELAKDHDV